MSIDQLILGDNQFFGVNHMSQDKGRRRYEQFKSIDEIKKIMHNALDNEATGVFFSTHPSIYEICNMIRKDERLSSEFKIYVNVPYIVKYVSMITEMGIYDTIKTVLASKSGAGKIGFFAKTGLNVVTLNHIGILQRLIDIEVAPFSGLNVKAIFLHNTLCDLALGYGMSDIILAFDQYIREEYGAIPGYGTLNYPRFSQFLTSVGLKESLVMTGVNKLGFLMNPDQNAVEEAIKNDGHTVLAMATLASGKLKPQEAYPYLKNLGVKNIVVGLSSKQHADETFGLIKKNILEC